MSAKRMGHLLEEPLGQYKMKILRDEHENDAIKEHSGETLDSKVWT